jgi:hypothetical protein
MSTSESVRPSGLPPGVTVISIHPMYSPWQVAGATFFGSPLGGGWLIALNYKRLAQPKKAGMAIVLSVLATVAMIALEHADARMEGPLLMFPFAGMALLARYLQGAAYDRHVAVGGSRGSTWRAAGLALVSLVIYFTASIAPAVIVRTRALIPNRLTIGGATIFYTDGVPRSEVRMANDEVMSHLYDVPDPIPNTPWSIEVTRDGTRPVIAFVLPRNDIAFSDDKIRTYFQEFAEPLSRKVYAGVPVDIWLVDSAIDHSSRSRVKLIWESRAR